MKIGLCLLNVLFLVSGQLLFKISAKSFNISSLKDLFLIFTSPILILAILLYGVATLLWVYILSKIDISFAYPIQSLALPVIIIISSFLFQETLTTNKLIGVIIICLGVFITVR